MTDAVHLGDHTDVGDVEDYLSAQGWETVGASASELFAANG
jgi:hypothetical protein